MVGVIFLKSYGYFIVYLDYGDSVFYPIHSHRRFNDDEFKELCLEAHHKVSEDYFYSESVVVTGDVCRLMRDYLCNEYPDTFFKVDVKSYVLNDCSVVDYNYF